MSASRSDTSLHTTRSPGDLRFVATDGPVIGSLCTGLAGLDLGVAAVLGGRIAWYCENDPHAARILAARLPGVPNLGDLRAADFAAVEPVQVLTAGFPCQDISAAGRRAGIEKGARSGLWHTILDAIRVLRPQLVVVENVAALRWKNGGLDRVLGGLADAGYDVVWRCVRAADIGAAHRRERVFLCAIPGPGRDADDAHSAGARRRATRSGRPGAASCGRASGEPQRRGRLGSPADAVASDADGGGLPLGGDPDRAQLGPSDPGRVRDTDRLGTAAADPDGVGCEELHPHHARRRTVPSRPRPRTQPVEGTDQRNVLRGNANPGDS
ncbi:DNA cytosine methyltransferase [Amycolatopsis sp. NPDC059021]|uniref:DNA cytosine methyltransferase n=1 Tax=Amycolatopsis sp. NPDC059021 TaxID=3346704 RepID=UPI0036729D0C